MINHKVFFKICLVKLNGGPTSFYVQTSSPAERRLVKSGDNQNHVLFKSTWLWLSLYHQYHLSLLGKNGDGEWGACAKIQISWWGLEDSLNLVLQIFCAGDQNLNPRQIVGSSRPLGVSEWLVEPKSKYHHGCKRCKPQIRAFPPTDWGPLVEGGSWGNRTMRGYLKGCLESKSHKSSNESIRHYGEVLSQVRAKLVSQCGLPGLF